MSLSVRMSRFLPVRCLLVAAPLSVYAAAAPVAQQSAGGVACEPKAPLVRVPELPEGSGLAASRRTAGRFWSHNDSGEAVLFALDGSGRVTGRVQVAGASVDDWEAIGVGPCPGGSCIYIADIGDNEAKRRQITVYRLPEPAADASGPAQVDAVFHATYPDGAHDAEALLVRSDGRLHIVTKGDTGLVSLYRFPAELRAGTTMRLERVGAPRDPRQPGENARITDGAVSPDDRWVVLRSRETLTFYRSADLFAGNWRPAGAHALSSLGEPQGEGVTFGSDRAVYLMSEGGSKKQPGAFARLTCTPGS
jgi:hypothetical protein